MYLLTQRYFETMIQAMHLVHDVYACSTDANTVWIKISFCFTGGHEHDTPSTIPSICCCMSYLPMLYVGLNIAVTLEHSLLHTISVISISLTHREWRAHSLTRLRLRPQITSKHDSHFGGSSLIYLTSKTPPTITRW
jgi:hypothetical protein